MSRLTIAVHNKAGLYVHRGSLVAIVPGGRRIHIHIHMLVSARVWRDKQIAMPGALRSRSFWLRAAAGLSFLGPLVPITTKEVSWLTPPPGSETSRTAAFHHSRSAPLCCGLLALSLSLPSASTLALLLAWRLF